MGKEYLKSVSEKIRRDRVKNEWKLKECGLNAEMNTQYNRSILSWFANMKGRTKD